MNYRIFTFLTASILFSFSATAGVGQVNHGNVQPVDPDTFKGVTVTPLDEHPVPELLKNQARAEIEQMRRNGYVNAPDGEVGALEAAQNDKKNLKPLSEVLPELGFTPSKTNSVVLDEKSLLGAIAMGGDVEEGRTGLFRLYVVPKMGVVALEEVDHVASGGGVALIEEAINKNVNGSPAIFRAKKSNTGKQLSQLTWATDRKIYTLSTNRALVKDRDIDNFVAIAQSISD